MPVIKIKLNQIVKMGYKSTYKSEMIQTRLEQGYYDDIVEAGIQGGVFDADTQPNKDELDLQLAKAVAGVDNCHLATIRITGVDSLSTKDDYEAFYQSVYEQLIDFRSTQKEILLDCDNLQAVARMNGSPLTEIPFVIKKAEINGSFHDSAALPVMKLHIYPLQKPDSSYCEAFVSLRMDSLENQGYTYSDSITIVEISPSDGGKIIYPEIVGYNWSNDGGDSSLTGKDVPIEQVIQKLTEKRQEIADLLEQNEAGLVYVKYGSSDLGTEQRPEVYFKVEKTYSRSYLTTGYILRFSVMSPGFENTLEPSIAWVFEDGTVKVWKKDGRMAYPYLGEYTSRGSENNLNELSEWFSSYIVTLGALMPENGVGRFDLVINGKGTLFIKVEKTLRQIGIGWERGLFYTVIGTSGNLDENYLGFVWANYGGGGVVVWRKQDDTEIPTYSMSPENDDIFIEKYGIYQYIVDHKDDVLNFWRSNRHPKEFHIELSSNICNSCALPDPIFSAVVTDGTFSGGQFDTKYLKIQMITPPYKSSSWESGIAYVCINTYIGSAQIVKLATPDDIPSNEMLNITIEEDYGGKGRFDTITEAEWLIKEKFGSIRSKMNARTNVALLTVKSGNNNMNFIIHKMSSYYSGNENQTMEHYKIESYQLPHSAPSSYRFMVIQYNSDTNRMDAAKIFDLGNGTEVTQY